MKNMLWKVSLDSSPSEFFWLVLELGTLGSPIVLLMSNSHANSYSSEFPEACFQEPELKRFFHSDHAVKFLLLRIQKLI